MNHSYSRSARANANDLVILKDNHWMLYWLVTAMYPQFLITLDENDQEQDVTVRVGQAVNTIGLAGTRSGISGVSVFPFLSFTSFILYSKSYSLPIYFRDLTPLLYPDNPHFQTNADFQFQTHQTPVRIATGDRAELGTNEFFPYQPVLEGLVVLKKNEGFSKEDH